VPYSAVRRGVDVFRALNRCNGEPPPALVLQPVPPIVKHSERYRF
jgi:hypothetical protein